MFRRSSRVRCTGDPVTPQPWKIATVEMFENMGRADRRNDNTLLQQPKDLFEYFTRLAVINASASEQMRGRLSARIKPKYGSVHR